MRGSHHIEAQGINQYNRLRQYQFPEGGGRWAEGGASDFLTVVGGTTHFAVLNRTRDHFKLQTGERIVT